MEENIAELVKWLVVGLCIALMMSVGVLVYSTSQLSNYQEDVNNIVEQFGGVNSKASDELAATSKRYHNFFTISANDSASKGEQGFGKRINYTIQSKIPVTVIGGTSKKTTPQTKVFSTSFKGAANSELGKD
jgi:hypothetical protein